MSTFDDDSSQVANFFNHNNIETIYFTERVFAAKTDDCNVITWGTSNYGGDSSDVANILYHNAIETISSNLGSFTAKTEYGNVITWGLQYPHLPTQFHILPYPTHFHFYESSPFHFPTIYIRPPSTTPLFFFL